MVAATDPSTDPPPASPLAAAADFSLGARIKIAHRVFGRRLLPLTARRLDLLAAFGIDEVLTEKKVDRIALRQITLVCSIKNPTKLFRRMHPLHPLTLLWRLRTCLRDTAAEAARLDAYLTDYSALPELWHQANNGRSGGQMSAPWLLAQCLTYQKLTGLEPWEVPIDVMAWELATLTEAEGGPTKFVTARDREIAARAKAAPEPSAEEIQQYRDWQAARASNVR